MAKVMRIEAVRMCGTASGPIRVTRHEATARAGIVPGDRDGYYVRSERTGNLLGYVASGLNGWRAYGYECWDISDAIEPLTEGPSVGLATALYQVLGKPGYGWTHYAIAP